MVSVAEILMAVSHFDGYSQTGTLGGNECIATSPADT